MKMTPKNTRYGVNLGDSRVCLGRADALERLQPLLQIFQRNPYAVGETHWNNAIRQIIALLDYNMNGQEPFLTHAHLFFSRNNIDSARLMILLLAFWQVEDSKSVVEEILADWTTGQLQNYIRNSRERVADNNTRHAQKLSASDQEERSGSHAIADEIAESSITQEKPSKSTKRKSTSNEAPSRSDLQAKAVEMYWCAHVLPTQGKGLKTGSERTSSKVEEMCDSVGLETERFRAISVAMSRAYTALEAIAGDSEGIMRVKKEAWEACFGSNHLKTLINGTSVVRDTHVLIHGETGVGKELVAQAIQVGTLGLHYKLHPPKIEMGAAAIPESLRMSELFGHLPGIATGVDTKRKGKIRTAHQGTLFLDEIAELDSATQSLLLRVIQEKLVQALGEDDIMDFTDVRYIGATHVDLEQFVQKGMFRLDLYERLAGRIILVPPLRDRKEDIEGIGRSLLGKIQGRMGSTEVELPVVEIEKWLRSPEVQNRRWRGNIRELYTALRNQVAGVETDQRPDLCQDIKEEDFPSGILRCEWKAEDVSDWYFLRAWEFYKRNQSAIGRALGVSRSKVHKDVKRLGLK